MPTQSAAVSRPSHTGAGAGASEPHKDSATRRKPSDSKICGLVSVKFIISTGVFVGLAAASAHYMPALAVWKGKQITPIVAGAAALLLAVISKCVYAILAYLCNSGKPSGTKQAHGSSGKGAAGSSDSTSAPLSSSPPSSPHGHSHGSSFGPGGAGHGHAHGSGHSHGISAGSGLGSGLGLGLLGGPSTTTAARGASGAGGLRPSSSPGSRKGSEDLSASGHHIDEDAEGVGEGRDLFNFSSGGGAGLGHASGRFPFAGALDSLPLYRARGAGVVAGIAVPFGASKSEGEISHRRSLSAGSRSESDGSPLVSGVPAAAAAAASASDSSAHDDVDNEPHFHDEVGGSGTGAGGGVGAAASGGADSGNDDLASSAKPADLAEVDQSATLVAAASAAAAAVPAAASAESGVAVPAAAIAASAASVVTAASGSPKRVSRSISAAVAALSPKSPAGGAGIQSKSSPAKPAQSHPFFQSVNSNNPDSLAISKAVVDWISTKGNSLPQWSLQDESSWKRAMQQIDTYLTSVNGKNDGEVKRGLEAILTLGTFLYESAKASKQDVDKWQAPMRSYRYLIGNYDASSPNYVGIQAAFVHLIVTKIKMSKVTEDALVLVLNRGRHSHEMKAFLKMPTKDNGIALLKSLDATKHPYVESALKAIEGFTPAAPTTPAKEEKKASLNN
ncbi:MAG: hypothetical protein H0X51_04745 [Parachlamydiaceae bacterium]|nr:hypothetical protein [Parachlamydiaceae bacterium]